MLDEDGVWLPYHTDEDQMSEEGNETNELEFQLGRAKGVEDGGAGV